MPTSHTALCRLQIFYVAGIPILGMRLLYINRHKLYSKDQTDIEAQDAKKKYTFM